MVVASLLYAVCLYRAYGALDTLSPYLYYELLILPLLATARYNSNTIDETAIVTRYFAINLESQSGMRYYSRVHY